MRPNKESLKWSFWFETFHPMCRVSEATGEDYIRYLKECDDRLLQANTDLRKRNVKLEVIGDILYCYLLIVLFI